MEFFELIAVVSVVLGVPSIVFYNIRRIVEAKHQARAVGGDGLRMSELQTLIEAAVEEATEPLRQEIDALKRHAPAGLLDAPVPRLSLDPAEALDESEEALVRRERVSS